METVFYLAGPVLTCSPVSGPSDKSPLPHYAENHSTALAPKVFSTVRQPFLHVQRVSPKIYAHTFDNYKGSVFKNTLHFQT